MAETEIKIAFLTPEFPLPEFGKCGGLGSSIKNLGLELQKQGAEVTIVVYGQQSDYESTFEGMRLVVVTHRRFPGLSYFFRQIKLQRVLQTLISAKKINIIEAPDWTGPSAFLPVNAPVVVKLHGSDTYFCALDHRKPKTFNRFREKRALLAADSVVSVSNFCGEFTQKVFNCTFPFTTIFNGAQPLQGFRADSQKSVVFYFGSLIRKKGVLELPQIFKLVQQRVSNVEFWLAGNDSIDVFESISTKKMLETAFEKEAVLNVIFRGTLNATEISEALAQASVCVFPSFAEALPMAWIEAMFQQKAIVASNIGWATEMIVDGKEGYLEHPKEHSEFANRICDLLENPDRRVLFGAAARKAALEKFDIKDIAKQNLDHYRSVIQNYAARIKGVPHS